MVRMSDILKKALEKKKQESQPPFHPAEPMPKEDLSKARAAPPVMPVPEAPAAQPVIENSPEINRKKEEINKEEKKEVKNNPPDISISSLVAKKASKEETARLYEEALSLIRDILRNEIDSNIADNKIVIPQIEKIINQLELGNEYLLNLAFIKDSTNFYYLYCHCLNVCIYSIEIGLGLGYEKSKLIELGVCAILHDIGMARYRNLVHQPRKLSALEYNEVKMHPLVGSELLANITGMSKAVVLAAFQHHERIDGSGYPSGLMGESISEYAKIINIVDVYEAMTHLRLYRDRHPALETVQEVLNNKTQFEYKLVKILIERIGIFPVGSFVRFNNKEVAQVIKLTRGVPLRPVVRIILDPNGKQVQENKIVDLTTQPTVYIKSEEKINWDWVRF